MKKYVLGLGLVGALTSGQMFGVQRETRGFEVWVCAEFIAGTYSYRWL